MPAFTPDFQLDSPPMPQRGESEKDISMTVPSSTSDEVLASSDKEGETPESWYATFAKDGPKTPSNYAPLDPKQIDKLLGTIVNSDNADDRHAATELVIAIGQRVRRMQGSDQLDILFMALLKATGEDPKKMGRARQALTEMSLMY